MKLWPSVWSHCLCSDFTASMIHVLPGYERVNCFNVIWLWCILDVQGPMNSWPDKLSGALPCLQIVCVCVQLGIERERGQPQGYMPLKTTLHKFRLIIYNNDSPVCWLLVYSSVINMPGSWYSYCKTSCEWEWGRMIRGHMEITITCSSVSIPDLQ